MDFYLGLSFQLQNSPMYNQMYCPGDDPCEFWGYDVDDDYQQEIPSDEEHSFLSEDEYDENWDAEADYEDEYEYNYDYEYDYDDNWDAEAEYDKGEEEDYFEDFQFEKDKEITCEQLSDYSPDDEAVDDDDLEENNDDQIGSSITLNPSSFNTYFEKKIHQIVKECLQGTKGNPNPNPNQQNAPQKSQNGETKKNDFGTQNVFGTQNFPT